MLVASRQGREVPVLARVMLLAGIGATIAANVGYGLHAGTTGAAVGVARGRVRRLHGTAHLDAA
jgi:hypothetical protein